MEFFISLAGHLIAIHSRYDLLRKICAEYIVDTVVTRNPSFVVEISEEDIAAEKKIQIDSDKRTIHTIENKPDDQFEVFAVQRKIAQSFLDYDVLLIHGSVIETNGEGYMFTAQSGVGKTTRTILWKNMLPGSIIVNGDKPWIHVRDDSAVAYGSPWCGKEHYGENTSTRLNTIFFLERAEEDYLTELTFSEAFPFLLQQTYYQDNTMSVKKTLSLLGRMEGNVRFVRFCSRPTTESVKLAYEMVHI